MLSDVIADAPPCHAVPQVSVFVLCTSQASTLVLVKQVYLERFGKQICVGAELQELMHAVGLQRLDGMHQRRVAQLVLVVYEF